MSLKSEFFNSWKNIESTIKVNIDKDVKSFGQVNVPSIKSSYSNLVKKWEVSVFYEGEWLERIGNEEFRNKFLSCLNNIEFNVTVPESSKSFIGYIVAALGFISFFVLKFACSLSLPVSILIAVIVMAAGIALNAKMNSSSKDKYNKQVKSEIINILNSKKEELGRLCDIYDK